MKINQETIKQTEALEKELAEVEKKTLVYQIEELRNAFCELGIEILKHKELILIFIIGLIAIIIFIK